MDTSIIRCEARPLCGIRATTPGGYHLKEREVVMSAASKRWFSVILMAVMAVSLVAATAGLQGCGSDQSKQDFVDSVLSIIEENQSNTEIVQEGQVAFQAYYQSGFTDLESAAGAAESFVKSNEKDALSLQKLRELDKPDEAAQEIVDTLASGIETMDEGNSAYAEELGKAPEQSVEERSQIFVIAVDVMGVYLEGIDDIIASCAQLLDYAQTNGLEGEQEIEDWYNKFQAERDAMLQSMEAMSGE
jgi:hypothetical protein